MKEVRVLQKQTLAHCIIEVFPFKVMQMQYRKVLALMLFSTCEGTKVKYYIEVTAKDLKTLLIIDMLDLFTYVLGSQLLMYTNNILFIFTGHSMCNILMHKYGRFLQTKNVLNVQKKQQKLKVEECLDFTDIFMYFGKAADLSLYQELTVHKKSSWYQKQICKYTSQILKTLQQ